MFPTFFSHFHQLLFERPAFENLAKVLVVQSCSNISEFEIPGLKSLTYKERTTFRDGISLVWHPELESDVFREEEPTTMGRFFRSLELLPTISPGFTALKVDTLWEGTHIPLLEESVNSLWLPCLELASIRVFLWDDSPDPDFNPFLKAHPTLYNVSTVSGRQPLCDPLLRTFAGRADDFLKVCDGARHIQNLAVTHYDKGCASEHGHAVVAVLINTLDLRRLAIVNGQAKGIYMHVVDHNTICAIGQACSGITHLELHLKFAVDMKALANLHELRWIRAHFWITVPNERGPAANIYDENFLDINNSEDGSEDENDHKSDPSSFYDKPCNETRCLLRVFQNHTDFHLLQMAPNLLEVEFEVVLAREQNPDSEHFDGRRVDLFQDFSFRIVHWDGKCLTVRM
ncbi:hypothetical protein B0H19DRAFT_1083819 [Mycena capillaripes]|nr:hypothetical protein B0H19DRAFT_1083819 [Mycena capillaripes]